MSELRFGDFLLDPAAGSLSRAGQAVPLTGRAFALLEYLARRPGQLISKQELLDTVWRGRVVTDTALSKRVQEIRRVLGDTASAPEYLETVPRRGYRFVAAIDNAASPSQATPPPIGRETEFATLCQALSDATHRRRQVVIVRGAAGAGKTTLLRRVVDSGVAETGDATVAAIGQCVENGADPFLPLADALSRVCHGAHGAWMTSILDAVAPVWLAEIPALLPSDRLAAVRRRARDATAVQRRRELSEALELASADRPILLVLEDLHWADESTLAWLADVARRPDPARLMIVASLRLGEPLSPGAQDVLDELAINAAVRWIDLQGLSVAQVQRWLAQRLGGPGAVTALPVDRLGQVLHEHTQGNPLFLHGVLESLLRDGRLVDSNGRWMLGSPPEQLTLEAPGNVRALIARRLRRLEADQMTLIGTASVLGPAFDAASVAALLDSEEETVEEGLLAVVRAGGLLEVDGPDPENNGGFRFVHDLFREAVYQELGAARRRRLHLSAAELLAGDGGDVDRPGRAATIASHLGSGGDEGRAAGFWLRAGRSAKAQNAFADSARYLRRGLAALERASDGAADGLELDLLTALGSALVARFGYTHDEVQAAYRRAGQICEPGSDPVAVFAALHGLRDVALLSADLDAVAGHQAAIGELAARTDDPYLKSWNTILAGELDFARGLLQSACARLREGCERYPTGDADPYFDAAWIRPDVGAMCYEALALSELGFADGALRRMADAEREADESGHALTRAFVFYNRAQLHVARQELAPAADYAGRLGALAERYGLELQLVWARTIDGYCAVNGGDAARGARILEECLAELDRLGNRLGYGSALASYAGALAKLDRVAEAVQVIDRAISLTEASGEPIRALTLRGVKGYMLLEHREYAELLWREFALVYQRATELGARSWQLRAALGRVLLCMADPAADQSRLAAELIELRRCYDAYPEHGGLEEMTFVGELLAGFETA